MSQLLALIWRKKLCMKSAGRGLVEPHGLTPRRAIAILLLRVQNKPNHDAI
jgi:hypothetical protein